MTRSAFLKGPRLRRFEALQQALVPRAARFTELERTFSRTLVEGILAGRPAAVRRQIALFLIAIDGLAFLRGGRSFRRLDADRRRDILRRLERSRSTLARKGLAGLATLAKVGVYGQPQLYDELGYRLRENPP